MIYSKIACKLKKKLFCRPGSFQALLPFVTQHFLLCIAQELISWCCRKSLQPLFMGDEMSWTEASLWPSIFSCVVVVFKLLSCNINLDFVSCRFSLTGSCWCVHKSDSVITAARWHKILMYSSLFSWIHIKYTLKKRFQNGF